LGSISSILMLASTTTLKASFTSHIVMSSFFSPAFLRTYKRPVISGTSHIFIFCHFSSYCIIIKEDYFYFLRSALSRQISLPSTSDPSPLFLVLLYLLLIQLHFSLGCCSQKSTVWVRPSLEGFIFWGFWDLWTPQFPQHFLCLCSLSFLRLGYFCLWYGVFLCPVLFLTLKTCHR
jgi:hypothetical protein